MKSPITDASRMTAIRKLSPLFDRLPDWKSKLSIRMVAGFAEKKEFVGCRGLIGTDELRCRLILSKCFGVQTNSMSRSR
jgi:Mlc titration factor MtfA (ptsG expression regulator)